MNANEFDIGESVSEREEEVIAKEFSTGNEALIKGIIKDSIEQSNRMMQQTIASTAHYVEEELEVMPTPGEDGLEPGARVTVEHSETHTNIIASCTEEARHALQSCKNMVSDKFNHSIDHFQAAIPILEHAGYSLTTLDVDIGLMPQIVARFAKTRELSGEEEKGILTENQNNKFTKTLLMSLFRASHIQKHIRIADLHFQEVEMYVGTLPKIKLRFRKKAA